MMTKRLQINCQARRADQQPPDQLQTNTLELPIFQHITNIVKGGRSIGRIIREWRDDCDVFYIAFPRDLHVVLKLLVMSSTVLIAFGPLPPSSLKVVKVLGLSMPQLSYQLRGTLEHGFSLVRHRVKCAQSLKEKLEAVDVEIKTAMKVNTRKAEPMIWPPLCFRQSNLGMENSLLFGKRWPHMAKRTQLPVMDTFFDGSCVTKNPLFNCPATDTPTPIHTSYDPEAIVEHLKMSQFHCSNRPNLRAIRQNSSHFSWIHTSLEIQGYTVLMP
ncbi:hypothetical protein T265_04544 [Opisthorchis viverrini]|uniref:Uncharacterized protein n=1 Tax=Opisthorchis viverrini TaxID=6198 RepID=A0A074ZMT5_OPIVI|nr:hypothetical protein T265_04544 [Opisthorchis viverrini]KER28673.1 hypothetical protein T265_04544 [Opisthorchis viverrini]